MTIRQPISKIINILVTLLLLQQCTSAYVLSTRSATTTGQSWLMKDVRAFGVQALSANAGSSSGDGSSTLATTNSNTLLVSLSKPLGLILEEDAARGVVVKELSGSGSVVALGDAYISQIIGSKIASVQGENTLGADFDTVMNLLVNAPENLIIEFLTLPDVISTTSSGISDVEEYKVGQKVDIVVKIQDKGDITIPAVVGDNLRKVLLENKIDVYQGMRQNFGNCGGAGQCTFCAFDFIESKGWAERSDYEDTKLNKFPTARLTCLNNIQGPATISKTQR